MTVTPSMAKPSACCVDPSLLSRKSRLSCKRPQARRMAVHPQSASRCTRQSRGEQRCPRRLVDEGSLDRRPRHRVDFIVAEAHDAPRRCRIRAASEVWKKGGSSELSVTLHAGCLEAGRSGWRRNPEKRSSAMFEPGQTSSTVPSARQAARTRPDPRSPAHRGRCGRADALVQRVAQR